MKKLYILFLILFIAGCATTGKVIYEEKEGPYKVIKVVDGDTIDLNNSKRVRFSGINTPETGECYYQEAKDKLIKLILNKDVFVERDITDEDKYKRLLRYIYFNNTLINSLLVEEGFARVYDKYSYDTKRYDELKEIEEIAINNKLGVWSCKDAKEGCAFVGSKNSDKYYPIDCKWAKKILPKNLICFKSEEEAVKVKYTKGKC